MRPVFSGLAGPAFTLVACAFLLDGCALGPTYPLLSPIAVANSFGYADEKRDPTHWVIHYVTPIHNYYGFHNQGEPVEQQSRALALDLAQWRASQLALQQGYAGFKVTDQKLSTDALNSGGFATGPDPYFSWPGPYRLYGPAWVGDYFQPVETTVQIEASLTITLEKTLDSTSVDAAATIARLRQSYPGAEGPPAGGGSGQP